MLYDTLSRGELISDVLLWTPTHGRAKAGRPARTYIQQLCEDTGCCPEDLPEAMNDREKWRERVRDIRSTSTTWWWWWWYDILFPSAKTQTVNTTSPIQPVGHLRYVVYQHNFMIAQKIVNTYEYKLLYVRFACFLYSTISLIYVWGVDQYNKYGSDPEFWAKNLARFTSTPQFTVLIFNYL